MQTINKTLTDCIASTTESNNKVRCRTEVPPLINMTHDTAKENKRSYPHRDENSQLLNGSAHIEGSNTALPINRTINWCYIASRSQYCIILQ